MTIVYKGVKVFSFADTHGMYRKLPVPQDVDILICARDACEGFAPDALKDFFEWYLAIPAKLRPKYHIFGHVHEEGLKRKAMLGGTAYLNVSCFERLRQVL